MLSPEIVAKTTDKYVEGYESGSPVRNYNDI